MKKTGLLFLMLLFGLNSAMAQQAKPQPTTADQLLLDSLSQALAPIEAELRKLGWQYMKLKDEGKEAEAEAVLADNNAKFLEVLDIRTAFICQHPQTLAAVIVASETLAADFIGYQKIEKVLTASPHRDTDYYQTFRSRYDESSKGWIQGQPAPDFTTTTADGRKVSLSDFRGQYVLLDFWASWCLPCRAKMKELKAVYEQLQAKGINLLSISVDEKREAWLKASEEEGIPWISTCEAVPFSQNTISQAYKVSAVPALFLIGPDGTILRQTPSPDELLALPTLRYSISGTVPEEADGSYAVLYSVSALSIEPIDSSRVSQGRFAISGLIDKPRIGQVLVKSRRGAYYSMLALENTPVFLSCDSTHRMKATGGSRTEAIQAYEQMSYGFYTASKRPSDEEIMQASNQFVRQHLNDCVGAFYFVRIPSAFSEAEKGEILASAGSEFLNDEGVKDLIASRKAALRRQPGNKFTDFELPDADGLSHHLSEYVGQGRYVLVDFWASWCGPCRAAMPGLKAVYEKYHDRGFDVVGVSCDSKREAWLKAMKDLALPWHQLSDLKGWNSAAAVLYGVQSIPCTVLIGPDGTILGNNLHADELDQKLSELTAAKRQPTTQHRLFKPDPAVRTGQLSNGLTYYIRHNEEPKERAFFYITQKVGSIQEEPNQRGLAHFLEHMCFNGTTHFPGDSLRTYLEKIGVKFGADLNAYTAVDETVYNIDNVPTTVAGAIDSCLWILHDWSHDLTLDGNEIDKERGVIQEEWRTRNTASQRMNEQMMPVIMAGSKYTDAMPIGSMDIVMNFDQQALRDYYQRWYRPDLQAVIVVGDISVDETEQKIKAIFADIPAPAKNAAKRDYYPVPDNQEPIFFCGTDKELLSPQVTFYFKHDATPREQKNTREDQVNNVFANFVYGMFYDHTRDITQKPNPPFRLAFIRDGAFFLANSKKALSAVVSCHTEKGGVERGTEAMLQELFRVRKHGFTQGEFDRYRHDLLASLDNLLKNRDKRQSVGFVKEYVRHFLDNDPYTTLEEEVAFWKEELPRLSVDDLNHWFRSLFHDDDSNMVIVVTGPENDSVQLPTKEQMLTLYHRVKAEDVAPYVDKMSQLPFLPEEPTSGTIVSETQGEDGLTHMELSNGAKVVVMRTDYRKDQILMQALAHGGSSLFPADMYRYEPLINMATSVAGWGNYNLSDMEKKFTGKTASVHSHIAENYQAVAGSCDAKDLKTLMEQVHAVFRYPHKDSDAFLALVDRQKRSSRESEDKPNNVFGDSLQHTLYGDNPYARTLKAADYDDVDYDALLALYRERFADASNFTFTFVGDINLDSLRLYLCQYVASLPSTYRHETARPVLEIQPGSRTCMFEKEQETPMTTIAYYYVAPGKFNRRQQTIASMLGQVLTITYTKTIREDAGAAYSVSAGATVDYFPKEQERIVVRFPTDPKNRDLAVRLVDEGIEQIAKEGPASAEIDKVKEYLIKVCEGNRQTNKYWQYVLSYSWNHPDEDYDCGYVEMVRSITPKEIQQMAQQILEEGSRILVVMSSPEDGHQ